jgi:hypothetical protein
MLARRYARASQPPVKGQPGKRIHSTDGLLSPPIGPEAEAIARAYARAGASITPGMAYVYDRGIRRLQLGGVWPRLIQLCIAGPSEGHYRVTCGAPERGT